MNLIISLPPPFYSAFIIFRSIFFELQYSWNLLQSRRIVHYPPQELTSISFIPVYILCYFFSSFPIVNLSIVGQYVPIFWLNGEGLLLLVVWNKDTRILMVWLLVLELKGESYINHLIHDCFFSVFSLYASVSALKDILNLHFAFYFVVYFCVITKEK